MKHFEYEWIHFLKIERNFKLLGIIYAKQNEIYIGMKRPFLDKSTRAVKVIGEKAKTNPVENYCKTALVKVN